MHARVTTLRVKPGKLDELVGIAQGSALGEANEQTGFKGLLVLTDGDADKAVFVTLWDTEENMQANVASGYYRRQAEKFAALVSEPTQPETYEVKVQA